MRITTLFLLLVLLASSAFAQNGLRSVTLTAPGSDVGIPMANTAVVFHQLTWTVSGTVSTCTVALDSSPDGVTWTAGGVIAGQTCTTNGSSSVTNLNVNFVRITVTALSGAGATINAVWTGFITQPGGSGGGVGNQSFLLTSYNPVAGKALIGCLATYTLNGTTITTGAADPPFTSANVGNIIFGTGAPCAGNGGGTLGNAILGASCPPTCPTIASVNSAHNITLTGGNLPTANAGNGTTCCMIAWGPSDGTANQSTLATAHTAATNACPSTLILPAGGTMFGTLPINTATNCGQTNGFAYEQPSYTVKGQGMNSTILIPMPGMSFASAQVGQGGAIFGVWQGTTPASQGLGFHDFQINGIGVGNISGAASGEYLLSIQEAGEARNLALNQYGSNVAGLAAMRIQGVAQGISAAYNVVDFNFGNLGFGMADGAVCVSCYVFTIGGSNFAPQAQNIYTYGSQFINGNNGGGTALTVGGVQAWYSYGDSILGGTNQTSLTVNQNSTAYLFGTLVGVANGVAFGQNGLSLSGNATGTIHACNSQFGGTTSAMSANTAGSTFFDDCPNKFIGTVVTTNTTYFGSASAAGTALATGNIGLTTGWATSTVATATGDSHKGRFTITGAAGSASPTLTLTFPKAYPTVAPASCVLIPTGTNTGLTTATSATASTTSVVFTISGTPQAVTYQFDYQCGP